MTGDADRDALLEQELTDLKKKYEDLRDDKVRTEEKLEGVKRRLKELEDHAMKEYGTADQAELEKLLAEKRAENERLVAEYRRHVEQVEADLTRVEKDAGEPS